MKIIIKQQKKPYEKWLKILGIIILVIAIYMAIKPEIKVVERAHVEVPVVSDDVTRVKSEVFINGFTDKVNDIRWIDNQIVLFKGSRDNQINEDFEVDLEALSVNKVSQEEVETTVLNIKDHEIERFTILKIGEERAIYFIDQDKIYGIYAYDKEGNYTFITENMKLDVNGLPLIQLSENEKKMLYMEASTDKIVTYDFETKKKKIINHTTTENDFYDQLSMSSDGGYILEKILGDVPKFNCFGSDSGKLYVDQIEGVSPVFSKEGDRLYYLYNGDMTSNFTGKRLGIITLSKKDIKYITAETDEVFFNRLLPMENNQLICLIGINEDDYFIIDEVIIYNPETNEKKILNVLKGMKIDKDSQFEVNDQMLIFPETETQLTLLNIESQAVQNFYDLTKLKDNALYIKNQEGYLLGYSNTIYRIDQHGKSMIYQYEGEYLTSSISPEGDKLFIVSKSDDKLNCVITFKLGIQY